MTYHITTWEGSNWKPEAPHENISEPGEYDVRIVGADYDSESSRYVIEIEDVLTQNRLVLSYWLKTKDQKPNNVSIGILVSIGKCLFGVDIGVPFYEDIINGVVHVEIVQGNEFIRKDNTVGHYMNAYSYSPVKKEVLDAVAMESPTIEQYTEG